MIIFFDFNPRSHERSDVKEGEILLVIDISIHAPTRGATNRPAGADVHQEISIHAPTRGATALVNAWFSVDGFQSTLPREERHSGAYLYSVFRLFQSTLPREERRTRSYQLRSTPKYFNPRSHERSDIEDQQARKPGIRFQSTLPREERRPRSSAGTSINSISIHAPTRGATRPPGVSDGA